MDLLEVATNAIWLRALAASDRTRAFHHAREMLLAARRGDSRAAGYHKRMTFERYRDHREFSELARRALAEVQ